MSCPKKLIAANENDGRKDAEGAQEPKKPLLNRLVDKEIVRMVRLQG
jgi:hypothetical protein